MNPNEREEKYQAIRKDYMKVVEDSQEKIQIAEESYALVDRYLRKLDQELHKFQLELEADNRGITEVLEKRSLELDVQTNRQSNYLKENRLPKKMKVASHPTLGLGVLSSRQLGAGLAGAGAAVSGATVYPLEQIGASSSAIAQAASQAIAATQLVPGRRSSSLKASYEAINLGVASTEFSIGRELATAASSALAATSTDITNSGFSQSPASYNRQKNKLKINKAGVSGGPGSLNLSLDMVGGSFLDDVGASDGASLLADLTSSLPVMSPGTSLVGGQAPGGGSDQEWNFDPNEPRYCICNQVSYGDMVACDNTDCPYEWFHYPCVGITAPPKVICLLIDIQPTLTYIAVNHYTFSHQGKWYCQPCQASMRRRGRK